MPRRQVVAGHIGARGRLMITFPIPLFFPPRRTFPSFPTISARQIKVIERESNNDRTARLSFPFLSSPLLLLLFPLFDFLFPLPQDSVFTVWQKSTTIRREQGRFNCNIGFRRPPFFFPLSPLPSEIFFSFLFFLAHYG